MARTVTEWRGKTDDTRPSKACQRRILERQDYCCALSGRPFTDKDKPEFDHKVALWLGGENREGNLHAIHKPEHKAKTAAEAKVHAKVNANINKRFGLVDPPKMQGAPFQKSHKAARRQQVAANKLPIPHRVHPMFQPKEGADAQ